MKALAHPLRLDVLDLLAVSGPMSASEAAVELGQTPANVSWHLRKLAEHGFVRQATSGPGRRRPWKVVAESLSWGEGRQGPGDTEDTVTSSGLRDVTIERDLQTLRTALALAGEESDEWRAATGVYQARLWLTAGEADAIGAEVRRLFSSRAEQRRDPTNRPADARVVALMAWVVPSGPDSSRASTGS